MTSEADGAAECTETTCIERMIAPESRLRSRSDDGA